MLCSIRSRLWAQLLICLPHDFGIESHSQCLHGSEGWWTQQPLHSGSPGCYSDHWPATSVGCWPCGCVWTCIPTSPRAFVRLVPLIMSKRVGVGVAGTTLLDGSPDIAVTRQQKCSPRHTDLYLKLVWAGRQELFMTFWAFRVSNEFHLSKPNITLIYFIHFSHYSTVMRTIKMLF